MPTTPVIDIEQLLAPVSDSSPTGEELSGSDFSGPLYQVKSLWEEARRREREAAKALLFGAVDSMGQSIKIEKPEWKPVLTSAQDVLKNHSKDFRVASWLTEGLIREHGFRGLRDGLQLCWELCERYWDILYPLANEEDGHGAMVAGFDGLTSEATFPIIMGVPIVKPKKGRALSFQDQKLSQELDSLSDAEEIERRRQSGQVSFAEFETATAETPSEFFADILDDLEASIELLYKFGAFFGENCKSDQYDEPTAPRTSEFRTKLELIRDTVAGYQRLICNDDASGDNANSTGDGEGELADLRGTPKNAMTREEAFKAIEKIASFFEKTEPHSPVQFALRQAVRWGRMPLPELLRELIEDQSTILELQKRVGLPPAPEE